MLRIRRTTLFASAMLVIAACNTGTAPEDPQTPAPPGNQPAPPPPDTATPPGTKPPGDGATPYQHFDINHVLSTGQSNSVGNEAMPPLTTEQPYTNLMFDVGVMPGTNCDGNGCKEYGKPTTFAPLVEGDEFFDYAVETMSGGMANQISRLATERYLQGKYPSHDVLVSLHGRSGNTYTCLRKGGCDFFNGVGTYLMAFDEAMMEVEDASRIAQAMGKSYVVRAVTAIHGESDHYAYTMGVPEFPQPNSDGTAMVQNYEDALLEWQKDYENGVKSITNQSVPVPLLVLQMSNWNDTPHSQIPTWQLGAHKRANGKVVLVGPGYQFTYAPDCLHYDNHAERRIGEYFAKVYARIVLEGKTWEPVRPIDIKLEGTVITAKFAVPKPPLVLDTNRVSNPGNDGFEFADGTASPPTISAVELAGPDTVKITLSRAPTGSDKRLRYAFTATPLTCPGAELGPRGNLRDSDDTPSNYGYELFNWGVTFDEPVN